MALTVNFAAPIADGDFEISRRASRTDRTNQHWIVELSQGGALTTTATAVFGVRRDTWSDTEAAAPVAPPPEQVAPSSRENLPVWVDMYDMRFAEGTFSGGAVQPVHRRQPHCGYATRLDARSTFRRSPQCPTSSSRASSCAAG